LQFIFGFTPTATDLKQLQIRILMTKNYRRVADLLVCEGVILGIYKARNRYFMGSIVVKRGAYNGTVYYTASKNDVLEYLDGKLTTKELYLRTTDDIVEMQNGSERNSYVKAEFVENIEAPNARFQDFGILSNRSFDELVRVLAEW
jgi:hypothetical protein